MGLINKFVDGEPVSINPKVYKDGQWVDVDAYKYQDGEWVNMTSQTYTKTFEATWTQSYRDTNEKRSDWKAGKLCQGEYVQEPWGIQRSLCGFGDIKSELAGAKILDVELYLKNQHWYYYAGGKAVIGYHNHASEPSMFSYSKYGAVTEEFSSRGQAKWIQMPKSFGEGIRDGDYKGISLFANTTNLSYYGYFYGVADGSSKPKLKITYSK
ncbi:hypothetical protein ACW5UC_25035 [Priestia aryabhattai]|uniref:hypothetical protein n=1 Tax=Priestia megaterium TaxID=1404 RepID=UPI003F94A04A